MRVAVLIAILALAGCETPAELPMTEIAFSRDSPKALLLQHRDKWTPIYERVDLPSGRTLPGGMIGGNTSSGVTYAGRVGYEASRATPAVRQELGIEDESWGKKSGGYVAYILEPGDYALIGVVQSNSNGYADWVDMRCDLAAAPVYHFEAGKVNMMEINNRRYERAEKGNDADPVSAARDVKLGEFLVAGYPGITADVQLAPFVSKIQYAVGADVRSPQNPCPRAGFFRPAPAKGD